MENPHRDGVTKQPHDEGFLPRGANFKNFHQNTDCLVKNTIARFAQTFASISIRTAGPNSRSVAH